MTLHLATNRLTRYGLLALLCAGVSVWFPANYLLVLTGLLSLLGAGYGLAYLSSEPASRFNFLLTAPVLILTGSSLGMLLSFIAINVISPDIWAITLDYAHATTADVALAQGYTNLFAIVLFQAGSQLQRRGYPAAIQQLAVDALQQHRVLLLTGTLLIIVCQLYLLQTGQLVYGGRDISDETAPTHPVMALITPLIPALPFALTHYIRHSYSQKVTGRLLLYGSLIGFELFWFFLSGRRSTIFFFLLAFAGFFVNEPIRLRYLIRHSLQLGLVVFIALKIADTYHKIRVANRFEKAQHMSVGDITAGLQTVDDGKYERLRNLNLAARASYSSLALGQFVNLFSTTRHQPLYGLELAGSLLFATPSDFLIDKRTLLVKEHLYERTYSLGLSDISETLYLESFIDFGWLGFLVYPLLLSLIWYLVYALVCHINHPLVGLFVGCSCLHLALTMIETDLITFLSVVRTILVYCLIALFVIHRQLVDASTPTPS
jgi:hypothetical protein